MQATLRRFGFQAMGSPCELQFYSDSTIEAKKASRRLAAEVVRLEKKYSRFLRNSYLTAINYSAGDSLGIRLDSETYRLLEHALACFEESEGLFDITSAPLAQLWDFRNARVPTQAQIDSALEHIGFHRLNWKKSRLHLPAGMSIDLGGIVKEYAADAVASNARRLGITHGLVNLGGDFAVIGPKPDDSPWPVGIVDPRKPDTLMAKINLGSGGIASSGDYARCFEHEGKRYSHIINPKTGWPCEGLRAVSVAANLSTVAGSMATIAMLKSRDAGIKYLKDSGLPHVYMTQEEDVGGEGLAPLAAAQTATDEQATA